jgi:DNA-binding NtrC family response regulator
MDGFNMESHENIKVLLVDDDEGFCSLISKYLKKKGFSVTAVLSARKALTLFNDNRDYDVLITDIRMSGMDGLELFQEIKRIDKDFPVIFISGCIDIESMLNAIGIGYEEHLSKPLRSLDEILVPIKKCVGKHKEMLM